jgi:hypothetical protein
LGKNTMTFPKNLFKESAIVTLHTSPISFTSSS